MYPPQLESEKNFLSKVRFELTNVPPQLESEKNLSKVRFELTNVPPPPEKNFFIQS